MTTDRSLIEPVSARGAILTIKVSSIWRNCVYDVCAA